MGQPWCLVNLDKRQYSWQGEFENSLFFVPFMDEELFLPMPSVHIGQPAPVKNADKDIRTSLNSSIFSRLPLELFDGIFECINNYLDCVCLGLTCHLLWSVGHRHIKKRYTEDAPKSWAGDRIICAGFACSRDLSFPPGLLTEEEEKEWNMPLPIKGCGCRDPHEPNTLSSNLANFAICRFFGGLDLCKDRREMNSRTRYDAMRRHFRGDDWDIFDSVLGQPETPVYQEVETEAPWILRNLSRKEYVREEALNQFMKDEEEEELMYGFEYDICLGHVILMRACWSPGTCSPVRDPTGIKYKGPWAGDRFDLMSAKNFQTVETAEDGQVVEWKDVSAEVVSEIKLIWEPDL